MMIGLTRLRCLLRIAQAIAFGLACGAFVQEISAASQLVGPALAGRFRPDRILVRPKPNVDVAAMVQLHKKLKTKVWRTFPAIGNLQILQLPPGSKAGELIAAYQQSGLAEYAEPDYLVQALLTPNDFRYWDG